MDDVDYYGVLGVRRDASDVEIRDAYRRKASAMHADHGGDDGGMATLNVARDTLLDPERRAAYDAMGPDHEYVLQKAEQTLESLFDKAFEEVGHTGRATRDGVLGIVRGHLDGLHRAIERALADADAVLAGVERRASLLRVRRRGDGVDLMERVVSRRLTGARQRVIMVRNDLRSCEQAIRLLDEYDENPQPRDAFLPRGRVVTILGAS